MFVENQKVGVISILVMMSAFFIDLQIFDEFNFLRYFKNFGKNMQNHSY